MKAGKNRFGRKDHPRRVAAICSRSQPHGLHWVAFLLIAAALALVAAPAQAVTGGASTLAASDAQAGSGLAFGDMRVAGATWYGPGLYGRRTACGQVLRPGTIGVAHRNLPCGTTVKFAYHGHYLVTQVIDRGPYTRGNAWDLTNGAREALGFDGAGQIGYAVELGLARH
jgi:rare lipoprotein A (peptidoglycan hydrolase)